jgi:hypothetical protein
MKKKSEEQQASAEPTGEAIAKEKTSTHQTSIICNHRHASTWTAAEEGEEGGRAAGHAALPSSFASAFQTVNQWSCLSGWE